MAEGIQVEAMGGDIPSVEVSGVTGQGLPDLVETLSAMAEMRSLHAEDKIPIHGYVLESNVVKGLGYAPHTSESSSPCLRRSVFFLFTILALSLLCSSCEAPSSLVHT